MNQRNNPFTLSFGRKPLEYISRPIQTDMILDSFQAEHSPNQVTPLTIQITVQRLPQTFAKF